MAKKQAKDIIKKINDETIQLQISEIMAEGKRKNKTPSEIAEEILQATDSENEFAEKVIKEMEDEPIEDVAKKFLN